MTDILIIEDNSELGNLIKSFLEREGYSVVLVENAEDGLRFLKAENVKILLLDIMLPGMSGFEALVELRKSKKIPVIVMSARTDDESKITGLDIGADDYIEKPFSVPVLFSKIKALLRRSYELADSLKSQTTIKVGDVTLDTATRTVIRSSPSGIDVSKVQLSGKEYDIFYYLMTHPKVLVPKEELFDAVWGEDCFSEMSTMAVYIRWLREKLEEDPKNPVLIKTVWKAGYIFGESL